jgi:nitrogen PTS system EIIA component
MHLTIDEVSQFLNIPKSTVFRWVKQGRIPVETTGTSPIFDRGTLERWARTNSMSFCAPDSGPTCRLLPAPGSMVATMTRGGVYYDIEATDVPSALRAAVGALSFKVPQRFYENLLDRESLASTGIGKGVAIPHTRYPLEEMAEEAVISTVFLKKSINYKAVDGIPVFVLFILISPSVQIHLHLLSRLAFCIREDAFVSFLKARPTPEDLYARIALLEEKLDGVTS